MSRLRSTRRGDRSAVHANNPFIWGVTSATGALAMATSYLPVVLSTVFAIGWIDADFLSAMSKFGIVFSLLVWATLGSRVSRRNLAAVFLLVNGVTLLLAAATDSPLGIAGYLFLAMLTAPSWMLVVRLVQDQGLRRRAPRRAGNTSGNSQGRATVIAWTVIYTVLITLMQYYAMIADDLARVLTTHGVLCLIGAALLGLVLPGEAPNRTTTPLTWAAWKAQFQIWRDPWARVRLWLWGLSAAMLAVTEAYLQRHLQEDLGQPLSLAAWIFTISAAIGVIAALWMDALGERYPRLCLVVGGLMSIATFIIMIVGMLIPSRATEVVLCYIAASLSEIASTALGTVFSIVLTSRRDGLDDQRLSMGNIARFTFQGLALFGGRFAWNSTGYVDIPWGGLVLALVFTAIVFTARALRYQVAVLVFEGAIEDLRVRYDEQQQGLVIDLVTRNGKTTTVPLEGGRFSAAGGTVAIEATRSAWWRRRPDASVPGPNPMVIGGRTLRFQPTADWLVSVRLAAGAGWRVDRSHAGVLRLFAPVPTGRRRVELTDAWLAAPVAPDQALPWSGMRWSALLIMDRYRTAHLKGSASRRLLWLELVAAVEGLALAVAGHEPELRTIGAVVLLLALGWLSGHHVAHAQWLRPAGGRRATVGWGIAVAGVAAVAATAALLLLADAQGVGSVALGLLVLALSWMSFRAAAGRACDAWYAAQP